MQKSEEYIKVKKKDKRVILDLLVKSFKFIDTETKMHVIVIPSLEITGYGETLEEADIMTQETLNVYGENLAKLSIKEINSELIRLGWSKRAIRSKIFEPKFNSEEKMLEDGIKDYEASEMSLAA